MARRKITTVYAIGAIAISLIFSNPIGDAAAQVMCGPYEPTADMLRQRHGERLAFAFLLPDGSMGHVFAAPGGSFTVFRLLPADEGSQAPRACLMFHGEGWQKIPASKPQA